MKRLCNCGSPHPYKCKSFKCPYYYSGGGVDYCLFDKKTWDYFHSNNVEYPILSIKILTQIRFILIRFESFLFLKCCKLIGKYWDGQQYKKY